MEQDVIAIQKRIDYLWMMVLTGQNVSMSGKNYRDTRTCIEMAVERLKLQDVLKRIN